MDSVSKSAIALGSFDGLHKGHTKVIACALSFGGHGFVPDVLLFDTHPLLSLTGKAPDEILQNGLREEIIKSMGAEAKYISFLEIMNMDSESFFKKILIDRYNAGAICCGFNYRFGKNGEGDCEKLKDLCSRYGVELRISEAVEFDGAPVSSTRIRSCILNGDIRSANAMLGRPFCYRATVVKGNQRGRLMGSPTVNQYFDKGFIIPKKGVYSSFVTINGKKYPSVTNIGLRPSFENEDLRSETHIIGFDGDLYGESVTVNLTDYLRDEVKFTDTEMLKAQIESDREKSKQNFLKGENGHV